MFHPTAIVESDNIGPDTRIFAYAHVMSGARIGGRSSLSDHVFVEGGAIIGSNVTVKNGVCIWEGVHIADDVFVGPRVVFTNDRYPRSPRMESMEPRYAHKENWLEHTRVHRGCSIGAGATICPGVVLGAYSTIGAGAVVTRSVEPFSLVAGVPAARQGDVCGCGQRLNGSYLETSCRVCGEVPEVRLEMLQKPAIEQLH